MSSTAIGSASVVLSANADGLTAGLDRAEAKVKDFAGDVGRKLDNVGGKAGGGGGFLSKILGGAALGGAVGAVAGTVAGAVMKGFEVLGQIPDMIRGFAEKATGPEAGPLQGIVAAMDKVGEVVNRVGGRFFAAFGPGIVAVSDVASGLADRFGDLIDKVGTGLGVAFTVGVELAGSLLTAVGELLESFVGWATATAGVSDSTEGLSTVAFAVFRGLGKAAAYAWDTVKAGAGAVAWVAGKITEGFGAVVESFRHVIDLAKALPDALRPDWVDQFSDSVGNAGRRIREVGSGISRWGADAVTGFGDSAAQVDQWMDGVEQRFRARRTALDQTAAKAGGPAGPLKLAGALERGSKEAYSLTTRFSTDAMAGASDPARQQVKAQEETNRLLREIARGIAGAAVLRTV